MTPNNAQSKSQRLKETEQRLKKITFFKFLN